MVKHLVSFPSIKGIRNSELIIVMVITRVRYPAGAVMSFSLHRVQTGSGAHIAYYSKNTGTLTAGIKRP
jgi:hypothetical protein